jgi:hypothetical protein
MDNFDRGVRLGKKRPNPVRHDATMPRSRLNAQTICSTRSGPVRHLVHLRHGCFDKCPSQTVMSKYGSFRGVGTSCVSLDVGLRRRVMICFSCPVKPNNVKHSAKQRTARRPAPAIIEADAWWVSQEEVTIDQTKRAKKKQGGGTHLDGRRGFALCRVLITPLRACCISCIGILGFPGTYPAFHGKAPRAASQCRPSHGARCLRNSFLCRDD